MASSTLGKLGYYASQEGDDNKVFPLLYNGTEPQRVFATCHQMEKLHHNWGKTDLPSIGMRFTKKR